MPMKNVLRVVLLPVVLYAAVLYSCYEIFYVYVVEGDDPWARRHGLSRENPIQSAGSLFGFKPRLIQKAD
jgi:hypothetical protein